MNQLMIGPARGGQPRKVGPLIVEGESGADEFLRHLVSVPGETRYGQGVPGLQRQGVAFVTVDVGNMTKPRPMN